MKGYVVFDNILLNCFRKFCRGRFAFLRWPLDILKNRVIAMRNYGLFNHWAEETFYPIRAVRYWWVLCALADEVRRQKRWVRIADVGCSKGFMKNFVGDMPDTQWVGLDIKIDKGALEKCGYQQAHECDFDRPLPLPDNSVDVVVFLHVIEHLPRTSFTAQELSRILRPGGLLLAGSPVAPRPIAWVREKQLRSRLKTGESWPGGHINSMSCLRWRSLAKTSGLDVEMLTGTFLARWSGSPLENRAWWLRLNQLWGAFFPSLGGEVYLCARKPTTFALQSASGSAGRIFMSPIWKGGLAIIFVVIIVFSWAVFFDAPWARKCPVSEAVSGQQDGNDGFYALRHPMMTEAVKREIVIELLNPEDIIKSSNVNRSHGKDANYFIPWDLLPSFSHVTKGLGLNIVEIVEAEGVKFALLNAEGPE
jgi:SAM-dependent methyltransferase